MKKTLLLLSSLLILVLTGCSSGITKNDLQANEWTFGTEDIGADISGTIEFHENNIDMSIDFNSLYDTFTVDQEQKDNELAKQLVKGMLSDVLNQTMPYSIDGETLKVTFNGVEGQKVDIEGKLVRKDKNIKFIFTNLNEEAKKSIEEKAKEAGLPTDEIGLTLIPK